MSQLRGRFFAKNDVLLELTLPAHNAALAGDELTTIQLNHEWREIVASALQFYWRHGKSDLALDNEDMLDDLLADLYDAETFTMRAYRPQVIDIGTAKTTTSLVPVAITDTGFNHTFTYPNAIIRCHSIFLLNSGGSNVTKVQVDISGIVPDEYGIAGAGGTTAKPVMASAEYSNLPLGVSKAVRLMMFVTGGTGTLGSSSWLFWEIEEWE